MSCLHFNYNQTNLNVEEEKTNNAFCALLGSLITCGKVNKCFNFRLVGCSQAIFEQNLRLCMRKLKLHTVFFFSVSSKIILPMNGDFDAILIHLN